MITLPIQSNKRFSINVLSNLAVYGVNLILGLFFTPYLIKHLGVSVYGLIPLATTITTYLSLLTLSINGALGRFLAIDLQRNNIISANQIFNTGLLGVLGVTILTLPILFGLAPFIPNIFNIPLGYETSSVVLFYCVIGSFFITQIDTCFSVSSWVKSRFDLRSIVTISSNITRVLLVIILFFVFKPTLIFVGYGILFSSIIALCGDFAIWKYLTPELSISIKDFRRNRIRELFGMGGWLVVNQIGTLLFLNIDLIVANLVLGSDIAGQYGSIIIFSTLFRALASTVATVLTPTIVNKYAINDLSSVIKYSKQAVKFMGLAIALPVGILCGMGGSILTLWLGESFRGLWLLLTLLIFHLPINLAVLPLFGIQSAYLKVKVPGIITIVMGGLNLSLAIFFSTTLGWGAFGIAIAAAMVLTIKNAFFTPLYSAHIQNIPIFTYIKVLLPGVALTLLIGILSFSSTLFILIDNWFTTLIAFIFFIVFGILASYIFLLNKEDKARLLSYLPVVRK